MAGSVMFQSVCCITPHHTLQDRQRTRRYRSVPVVFAAQSNFLKGFCANINCKGFCDSSCIGSFTLCTQVFTVYSFLCAGPEGGGGTTPRDLHATSPSSPYLTSSLSHKITIYQYSQSRNPNLRGDREEKEEVVVEEKWAAWWRLCVA
ncbi:unnamed protein product [Prunus armeniaca]|uniref:Uncharacterized protein n=1 Tax=Prunus armeniaca TaxID=36596 RepID=A0A6J5Y880_PRUAR|nr:unnamed protein product [Prunus armeniaca]